MSLCDIKIRAAFKSMIFFIFIALFTNKIFSLILFSNIVIKLNVQKKAELGAAIKNKKEKPKKTAFSCKNDLNKNDMTPKQITYVNTIKYKDLGKTCIKAYTKYARSMAC